jgi:hypothetical protein
MEMDEDVSNIIAFYMVDMDKGGPEFDQLFKKGHYSKEEVMDLLRQDKEIDLDELAMAKQYVEKLDKIHAKLFGTAFDILNGTLKVPVSDDRIRELISQMIPEATEVGAKTIRDMMADNGNRNGDEELAREMIQMIAVRSEAAPVKEGVCSWCGHVTEAPEVKDDHDGCGPYFYCKCGQMNYLKGGSP